MIKMTDKVLKVNIQKELNEFDLDVGFELKKGRLGILGPSGCGKSMTLKSIAGIVSPDTGIISLNTGEETVYFDSDKKIDLRPQDRNVGYLFQNYALFPNMTVEENVAIGLSKDDSNKSVSDMIKRFHLEGLEKDIRDNCPEVSSRGLLLHVYLPTVPMSYFLMNLSVLWTPSLRNS